MITLPVGCRIYLTLEPINMHASFDKLALLVEEVIQQSPLNGHLFVFRNRQRDKLKAILWDRNGFSIYYCRLEKGRFKIPKAENDCVELSQEDFGLLLDGIDISKLQRFPELHYAVAG